MLTANHLSGAPVLAGDTLAGVVSMGDILGLLSAAPEFPVSRDPIFVNKGDENLGDHLDDEAETDFLDATEQAWAEWATVTGSEDGALLRHSGILDSRTVEEIMTQDVFRIKPGASVKEAAAMMGKHGIHRLVVTDHKSVVGVISALDIARAVSSRGLAHKHEK